MRAADKRYLVDRLSLVQAVTLVVGVVAGGMWLNHSFRAVVRAQMLKENTTIARQMAAVIAGERFGRVDFGDAEWDRLQKFVEGVVLPNDGYLCVAGAGDGRLLCHPEIRDDPSLRNRHVRDLRLAIGAGSVTVAEVAAAAAGPVSGVARRWGGTEVVSVATLPSVDGVLLVHQQESAVHAAVARLLLPVAVLTLTIGGALIFILRAAAFRLIGKYESRLEKLNDRLEKMNGGLEKEVERRTRTLMKTRDAVIFGLAKLAESRDNDTGDHLDRIRAYVGILARALRPSCDAIDDRYIETLEIASSLHDIGKVAIADAVLLKPGRLDPDERAHMETHAEVGHETLFAIDRRLGEDHFLDMASEICGGHHEKWDGSGYPAGIAGETIPLSARIVAVADVYDALRSKRPYKDPMPHGKAVSIILEGRGKHFDPRVVDAFVEAQGHFLVYSEAAAAAPSHRFGQGEDVPAGLATV